MPRLRANVAVCEPTRPMPTTPSVLEESSLPTKRFRSHFPPLREETAEGILRASENIMAMVCSAVVMTLPSGAFTTRMPRMLAASRSTLSTPIPARATILSVSPAPISSSFTCVPLRTMSASDVFTASRISSREEAVWSRTSKPCWSSSTSYALGEIGSAIRTRNVWFIR